MIYLLVTIMVEWQIYTYNITSCQFAFELYIPNVTPTIHTMAPITVNTYNIQISSNMCKKIRSGSEKKMEFIEDNKKK